MHVITSTIQFGKKYPEAFNALPEPYQADDCLEYQIISGLILCYPKSDQEIALGNWVAFFRPKNRTWEVKHG